MKHWICLLLSLQAMGLMAQKYKTKEVAFNHYQYPLVKLDTPKYGTYSVSGNLPDYMGGNYALARQTYSIANLRRSGTAGGDIEVLVNFPYYQEDGLISRPAVVQGSQTVKINGRDSSVPAYSFQGSFYQHYEYTIRDNTKGKDISMGKDKRQIKVATDWYRNSDEAVRNWETALRSQMANAANGMLRDLGAEIAKRLTWAFGIGKTPAKADVYYMKDKGDYADLDSAAQIALAAYAFINETQMGLHKSFAEAVAPAEAIWLRAFAQYEPDNKKARINNKVANIILFNLAWAAYWKNDFAAALNYADLADENDKRDGWVNGFEAKVKERQERMGNSGN